MQKRALTIIVAILIIGGGAYAIFHKSTPPGPTPPVNSNAAAASNNTPQPAAAGAVIETKTSSSTGSYLANSSGEALYTYGGDTTGVSNCSGSCLTAWPIYDVLSSSSLPANVSIITRSDGARQYAYKGLPLYTFTGDSSGQVTGDGVSDFHVAKP